MAEPERMGLMATISMACLRKLIVDPALLAMFVTIATGGAPAAGADTPSAMQVYAKAFTSMQMLDEPAYVSYRFVTGGKSSIHLSLTIYRHDIWVGFPAGAGTITWNVVHRTNDFSNELADDTGKRYVTTRSFFDPTWQSGYHAMRDGMFFWNYGMQPDQRPVPAARPPVRVDAGLKIIASEAAVTSTLYDVHDRGTATCPNEDPGRVLQLTARASALQHQMSAVVVDVTRGLFCVVRFTAFPNALSSLSDDEYYGDVGGYWVRTGGKIESITTRYVSDRAVVGNANDGLIEQDTTKAVKAVADLTYEFANMTFPASEPAGMFSIPVDQ